MHQNGLIGIYLGFEGVPNPVALVLSLYNKQFLQNENVRGKVV